SHDVAEIWDVERRLLLKRLCLTRWCWMAPEDAFPASSGADTLQMAKAINGRWDLVLPAFYPVERWGGSLTAADPVAVSADGQKLIRVVLSRSGRAVEKFEDFRNLFKCHIEEWDLVRGTQSQSVSVPTCAYGGYYLPSNSRAQLAVLTWP